jgi:hypothetical protein
MRVRPSIFFAVIVSAVLSSCGGGGDGGGGGPSGPVASTLPFPIAGAISVYEQTSHSFTLNGTDNRTSNSYTFTYSFTPGAATTFEGSAAQTASTSAILKTNGVTTATGSGTDYYQVNPFVALGHVSTTGQYAVASSQTAFPTTGMVGQTGAAWLETQYANSSKATVQSTTTVTWSLEADTAMTAWFCLNYSTASSNPTLTESDCYKVDGSGNVLGYKLTTSQSGTVLTLH